MVSFPKVGTPLVLLAVAEASVLEDWFVHETRLPEPVSDLSATADPTSGLIYLVGGCNSENGNSLIPNTTYFGCSSVTNAAHVFDTASGLIDSTSIPDAPQPRYRHAAVYVEKHLWMMGGRDLEDSLVAKIDVYSIEEMQWLDTTSLTIPEELLTSDLAAFAADDGMIYVTGGYLADYEAVSTTFAIDPVASLSSTSLVYTKKANLQQARGDAHAAFVPATNSAYMLGGFTHEDGYCTALSSVERYDFRADVWKTVQPLTYERGDKALAALGSRLFAIGGEANTDCAADPGQRTAPTTEVEVLNTKGGDDAQWTEEVADIPDDHFRFPAASYKNTIYTFGGQAYYQASCQCFPTRDTILVYRSPVKLGAGPIAGVAVAAVLLVGLVMYLAKKMTGDKERSTGQVIEAEQEMKVQAPMN